MNYVIETTIFNGQFNGGDILLLQIPIIPTVKLFEFERLQFAGRLAFEMTINKA